MKNLKFPCYVQTVWDVVNGVENNYPEFTSVRKHSSMEKLSWNLYVHMAAEINKLQGHPNYKKEFARQMVKFIRQPNPASYGAFAAVAEKLNISNPVAMMTEYMYSACRHTIPNYRLTEEEYKTILQAEEYGRGKPGILMDYCGKFGHKEVLSVDYRNIPANKDGRIDVVLVYSGHQQTGHKAAELVYRYVKNNGKFPDHIFNIGFEDNQNMTDFGPQFKLRKRSEADTYANEEEALGLPESWVRQLWLDPNDTDTWQNIKVVASLKRRFGLDKINLIIIGYPVYQLRTATEFAWGLDHADDAPDCNIIIADIPTKPEGMATINEANLSDWSDYDDYGDPLFNLKEEAGTFIPGYDRVRVLSYDQPLYQLGDLSLANCCAHIHLRTSGDDQIRYAIPGLAPYPESFMALAPMFMSYSYPNVISALYGCEGEDKDKVEEMAGIMKILRYLQLCEYDEGMSGKAMDEQESWYVRSTAEWLERLGLTSVSLMEKTRKMSKEDALKALLAYQAEHDLASIE